MSTCSAPSEDPASVLSRIRAEEEAANADPLVMPQDEFELVREVAETAGVGRVERDTAAARTLITPVLLAEVGRRLYDYENAITWNTSCTSCARVLDSAVEERERAERAEARLAAIRSLCADGAPAVAVDRIEAVLDSEQEK